MIHKKISSLLIIGILVILIIGCATQPVEPQPTETSPSVPTSEPEIPATLPAVDTPTMSPIDTPTQTSEEEQLPYPAPETESTLIRFVIVAEQSEARYRVREQLAGLSLPNDAVGVTQAISGMMVVNTDGTIDSSQSSFEVDLSTLTSDRSQRDNFLRNNTLSTNQYPLTVFVPNSISGLPEPLPQSGEVSFVLSGDLTIRDVTKPVEWEVMGNLQGDFFSGSATTIFTFNYFELVQPRVASVLSIEDNIGLEVDFTLQRVDN